MQCRPSFDRFGYLLFCPGCPIPMSAERESVPGLACCPHPNHAGRSPMATLMLITPSLTGCLLISQMWPFYCCLCHANTYRLRSKPSALRRFAGAPAPEHGEEDVQWGGGVCVCDLVAAYPGGMLIHAAPSLSSPGVLSLGSFGIDPLGSAQSTRVGWIIFAGAKGRAAAAVGEPSQQPPP